MTSIISTCIYRVGSNFCNEQAQSDGIKTDNGGKPIGDKPGIYQKCLTFTCTKGHNTYLDACWNQKCDNIFSKQEIWGINQAAKFCSQECLTKAFESDQLTSIGKEYLTSKVAIDGQK